MGHEIESRQDIGRELFREQNRLQIAKSSSAVVGNIAIVALPPGLSLGGMVLKN
jgi:hypothetical protein